MRHKRGGCSIRGRTGRRHAPGRADGSALSRERILDAAEKVFSKRGYDGARVDEIAAEAGLNKALIYYYFEGKRDLLLEIIDRLIREIVATKEQIFKAPVTNERAFFDQMRRILDIASRRRLIFGILVMESIKNDERQADIFQAFDKIYESSVRFAQKLGLAPEKWGEIRTPAFFFGLTPFVFFEILKDKWARHYRVDRKRLQEEFSRSFEEIYGKFAMSLLKERIRPGRRARNSTP